MKNALHFRLFRTFICIFAFVSVCTGPIVPTHNAHAEIKPDTAKPDAVKPNAVKPDGNIKYDADADALNSFVANKEKALSKNRLGRIKRMRKIIRKNPQYRNKANLLFQIADLEWKESKYHYFLERKKYDKKYEDYLNGTLKKRPKEPEADYSKALDLYKDLLNNFPNYPKIDQVMYYLAQGLKMAGNTKEMATYMGRLIREHPKSKYRTKAYLALAETFFDRNAMMAAKTNYLEVVKDKKAGEYPFALYKLGYAQYNLNEYDASIKSFQEVIKLGREGKRKISFQNQAYSALALSFTEVKGGWQRAQDYFQRIGGEELAIEQLERMARIYGKQDKMSQELAVYEYLISKHKTGIKIPAYADSIIANYKKQEDLANTEKQINRFFMYFDNKGSWSIANSSKDAKQQNAMQRAKQFRKAELDWMINTFHTKAQEIETESKKTRKAQDYDKADKLHKKSDSYYGKAAKYYDQFLTSFPKSKGLYEKEFFLAEILSYQKGNWDKAIKHYTGVMKRDPEGKYSKESAYKVILCAEEKMSISKLITPPEHFKEAGKTSTKAQTASVEYTKGDKNTEFKPLTKKDLHPTETSFLAACKNYTDFYPKDKEVPAISFRAAELFIRAGHYSEGINRLEVIMEHHSKHKFASFAAATLFDANYRLRRWDQMERWGRYMLKKRNFKVLKKKQLQDIIAISINNYAAELSEKGTALKKEGKRTEGQKLQDQAVDQMLRFIDEFPKHEKAAIALSNAAFLTERAERTEKAVTLYERLIKTYKKSPQATEAHFVLGALYESQTRFDKAASYFEKMAAFPDITDMKKIKDSLYNAGAIRMALQQHTQAIKIFKSFIKKFPKDKLTSDLYFQIAKAYETMKKWKKARKTYKKYIKTYKKSKKETLVRVHLLMAESYQKEGGRKTRKNTSNELAWAIKIYKQLDEKQKEDPKIKYVASMSRFLQAEYLLQDFLSYKIIPHPQRKLVKTLQKKAELQQNCEKVYLEVLEFKAFQVSAGAFYRIANAYNVFAKTLTNLEPPTELEDNPELLDVYQIFIEERVLPLEEKAVESAKGALQLAHANRVYNKWSKKSAQLLATLSPELFPVLNDEFVNTEWEVPATFSTQYIADPAGKLEMMIRKTQGKLSKKKKNGQKGKKAAQDKTEPTTPAGDKGKSDSAPKSSADKKAKNAKGGK